MQLKPLKSWCAFVLRIATVCALTATAHAELLDISVIKAPVAPDGTTAAAPTDFVLTFRDRDPAEPGISMMTGGTVTVTLPDAFTSGPGGNLILLQGWPQSPPAPPPLFPWTTVIDGNTVTSTITSDYLVGAFGPGMKQVHLLLLGFQNPGPGRYPVSLAIDADGDGTTDYSGIAYVQIIPRARPNANAVGFFSGPPGPMEGPGTGGGPPPFFNPLYQTMSLAELSSTMPRPVGLYVWQKDSAPGIGIDIQMTNATHGRLVQDRRTVGQVFIHPPPGASNFSLDSVMLASGRGPASFADTTGVTGLPTGTLVVRFSPDPAVPGDYAIDISMNGGNTERLFVTTTP